ncbi:MAG: nuclear transport factor 2 family protein [Pseudomonadota bacterium]
MSESNMLKFAEALIHAIEHSDVDTVRKFYAEDAAIWHNNDRKTQTPDENMRVLAWMRKRLSNIEYRVHRLEALPDGFVQEHVLTGKLSDGSVFEMPAAVICKVKNGQVTELREYLDSSQAAALMS